MNNKLNTEEIMLLIPDYITGSLSGAEMALVKKALDESPELNELYTEMKNAMGFVSSVKHSEPAPQYWNSLLPRIHERIEAEQNKGFAWDKISALWKILVPVAAIILIALVYYIVKPSNTQFTEDKNKEQKIEDKIKEQQNNKQQDNVKENKENIVKEQENIEKNPVEHKDKIRRNNVNNNGSLAKDNTPIKKDEMPEKVNTNDELLADDIDVEETAIFASGEGAGLDEETENEIKKLNSTEQNNLLEDLLNSNL